MIVKKNGGGDFLLLPGQEEPLSPSIAGKQ